MSVERMYPGDADLMTFSHGDLELTMVISDAPDDDRHQVRLVHMVTFINVCTWKGLTTSGMLTDDGIIFVEHPIRLDEEE